MIRNYTWISSKISQLLLQVDKMEKRWTLYHVFIDINAISKEIFFKNSVSLRKRQKQPSRGVLMKRCSENMQQIYKRTPTPICDFNEVTKQLYWNHTLAWVISCKFTADFQSIFSSEHLWRAAPEKSFHWNPHKIFRISKKISKVKLKKFRTYTSYI